MSKVLLITGATGKQGGSVIDVLISTPEATEQFTILAVTRNPSSAGAKLLAAKSPFIKLVQGDFDNPTALFTSALSASAGKPIWGVFSVQVGSGGGANAESEERQGKAFVDAAAKNGVKVFVQTSADRGGVEKSWTTPTPVPHFASKHAIELYLRDAVNSKNGEMQYTILRPAGFFENLEPGFQTKVFAAVLKGMGSKKMQWVATNDIGWFAVQAFLRPEDPTYKNAAISLAGDELNFGDMDTVFRDKTGHAFPVTFGFLGSLLLKMVKELDLMFKWIKENDNAIDIVALRKIHPEMMDFGMWLEKDSKFVTKPQKA